MIKIKNSEVLNQLLSYEYDPKLTEILSWLDDQFTDKIIITCGYEERNGVHGVIPVRGIDIRSKMFKDPDFVSEYINRNWSYDPERPNLKVALYHNVGRGDHFHIQVHPNTEKIKHGGANMTL